MYKVIRFLELMWIAVAAFCVIIGTYKLFTMPSYMDALFFYVFGVLAVLLFFLRRRQRRSIEKDQSGK